MKTKAGNEAKYFLSGVKTGLFFLIAASSLLLASISNSGTVTILLTILSAASTLMMVEVQRKAFRTSFWLNLLTAFLGIPYGGSLFVGVLMGSFPRMIGSFLAPPILALGLWGITGLFRATYWN